MQESIPKRRTLEKTYSNSTSEVCGYLRGINEESECGKCEQNDVISTNK